MTYIHGSLYTLLVIGVNIYSQASSSDREITKLEKIVSVLIHIEKKDKNQENPGDYHDSNELIISNSRRRRAFL